MSWNHINLLYLQPVCYYEITVRRWRHFQCFSLVRRRISRLGEDRAREAKKEASDGVATRLQFDEIPRPSQRCLEQYTRVRPRNHPIDHQRFHKIFFLFVQRTKNKIKTIAFVNVVFWFSTIADIAHIKFLLHNRIPEQTTYGLSELVLHSLCLERALPIHPASVPRHSVQHGWKGHKMGTQNSIFNWHSKLKNYLIFEE